MKGVREGGIHAVEVMETVGITGMGTLDHHRDSVQSSYTGMMR